MPWYSARPMKRNLSLAACALAVLPLGCIYPAERGKMLEERVDRLESDKKDLEQELKKQKNRLDEQVKQLQETLEKLEKLAHRTGADIGQQVEQVQTELSRLRGQTEQYQHQLAEVQALIDKLKALPVANPGTPAPAGAGASSDPTTPAEPKKPDAPPKKDEKPTDKKAFAELVTQKLADEPKAGRELASEFLKKWPKDALAARVHLELGSSYMGQKDWRAALSEFGEIVKSFAKTDHAPAALLKSADCFAALKMNEESRLALEEIVNSYPKSEAAKDAKTRLAELKKKPAPKKK